MKLTKFRRRTINLLFWINLWTKVQLTTPSKMLLIQTINPKKRKLSKVTIIQLIITQKHKITLHLIRHPIMFLVTKGQLACSRRKVHMLVITLRRLIIQNSIWLLQKIQPAIQALLLLRKPNRLLFNQPMNRI